MNQHRKPCASCPFSRASTPGHLGGSPPDTFIGQAHGGLWLPCHCCYEPDKPASEQSVHTTAQCAGAAIYRANNAIPLPSRALLVLDPDRVGVFATPAEFLAHHAGIELASAKLVLAVCPPSALARRELRDARVKVHVIETKTKGDQTA